MKIAIASPTNEKTEVNQVAGRAPFYLIFDEKGNHLESIKNPFAVGGGGAGFGVAKMLKDKDVSIVIAGQFGSNMISALEERGVKYYEKSDDIQKVLEDVLKGTK